MARKEKANRIVSEIFHRELMPAAAAIAGEGKFFFPLKPDPGEGSYYTRREKRGVSPEDFLLAGCESCAGLQEALAEMWREQGYPQLARAAVPLANLARALRETEEESEEVSPFIYVMF